MKILSILAIFCSFCCLSMGVVSIWVAPRSPLNRVFFAISVLAMIWTLAYAMVYSIAGSSLLWLFFNLSTSASLFLYSTLVLFLFLICERTWEQASLISLPLYVLGTVISVTLFLGPVNVIDFIWTPLGNVEVTNFHSWTSWIIGLFYLIPVGISIMLYQFSTRTSSNRLRIMTKFLSKLLFVEVSGSITIHFLWQILGTNIPSVGQMWSSLVLMFGALFAILKYKMLDLDGYDIEAEIFENLPNEVFFFDNSLKIVVLNSQAINFTRGNNASIAVFLQELFDNQDLVVTAWKTAPQVNLPCSVKGRPYFMDIVQITNRFGDQIGGMAILRGESSVETLAIRCGLTEREKEVLSRLLLGDSNREIASRLFIDLETVRTHTKNINAKMGTQNRGDLGKLI